MTHDAPVWLFDAKCLLCSGAVQFVLRHERSQDLRFVAIQSAEGRAMALRHGMDPDDPASFLFVEEDVAYAASDGVMQLLKHVGGWARHLRVLRFLPRALRNTLYFQLARNRYRLFGKSEACMVPDAGLRKRFVLPDAS